MERRTVLGVGLAVAGWWAAGTGPAEATLSATGGGRLREADVAAARGLFTAGEYGRLRQALGLLTARAREAGGAGPVGAGRAVRVWVLVSQLAVKDGDVALAAAFAAQAEEAARRSGRPVLLAAAARAAATPLRRTGRAGHALQLLQDAHDQLDAVAAPSADVLDASGMVALTAAYTAAQARQHAAAEEFAALAEQSAQRLAHPSTGAPRGGDLSVGQCTLYRIGIHRELGDVDRALAYAARLDVAVLPTPERRARAATDTARALLAADDVPAAFAELQRVEQAALQEARRPSVRALTAEAAARRPDLPGITAFARRTAPPRSRTT
ncbi:transcriptional regulator [Streptomyces sp. NPDC048638]|uniref:transcriptional regulator n=1 Tax=Streptomyces sp. NPDC048638 TaxID=3365580 RepID=UPI00371AE38A